jgi:hypothetical protein
MIEIVVEENKIKLNATLETRFGLDDLPVSHWHCQAGPFAVR